MLGEKAMSLYFSIVTTLLWMAIAGQAYAQPLGQGGCVKDVIGQVVCSPPGGGIQKDAINQVVCGKGHCIRNAVGQVVCSSQVGGYATKDATGQAVCTGGCESASSSNCQRPQ
jgi:hypothetical protein